ncbi:hypothetical protein AS156_26050 [Bradyrhizobium macuxiense]|uniref:Uncharacterized protein n=1 Tax=Bradyrhizobium macuxiense TaxID=1755647 RepID=A0A120FRZ3_9BRAD|nr:hypothetical protein AS156_26050 [Bradyrhizobium macuxiense]
MTLAPVAERTSGALSPNATQERAMPRKRSIPLTFHDLLSSEKTRLQEQLKSARYDQERELIGRRLRQIEAALRSSRWMASAELQPPS